MHGIIHKTLKEYVVAKTDAETWEMIVDRADLEPTLYLPISSYDDYEIDRILETLSSMAVQNGRQIECDFGRTLAPELLTTFNAHLRDDWDLLDVLEHLESITAGVGAATNANSLPTVSGTRVSAERVRVTYRTDRERVYCGLARGILEGLAAAFDDETTVTETACVRDGDETCAFRVK